MTRQELSQYHWLTKEIEKDEKRLKEIEEEASLLRSPQIDGMPKGKGGVSSAVENYVAELVDLQAIIMSKKLQCVHQRNRIERYISSIDDSLTRMIFTLRCIEGYSWKKVCIEMGSPMTEHNVRQMFSRYIREHLGDK